MYAYVDRYVARSRSYSSSPVMSSWQINIPQKPPFPTTAAAYAGFAAETFAALWITTTSFVM